MGKPKAWVTAAWAPLPERPVREKQNPDKPSVLTSTNIGTRSDRPICRAVDQIYSSGEVQLMALRVALTEPM
jgi:hypothetical protein